ncbi:hypothetical protein BC829DRAFT_444917 [Chytridium lagenaria]|nr:hypothetical protein BC829DRAFT_444917 [Chytridium lagenaria]
MSSGTAKEQKAGGSVTTVNTVNTQAEDSTAGKKATRERHLNEIQRALQDPVSLDANASVAWSHFQLLVKIHDHPYKGVDDSGKTTKVKPARPIIVDDDFRLAQFKFNIRKLVEAYPIQWVPNCNKRILMDDIEKLAKGPNGLYNETDTLELLRLRWRDLRNSQHFSSDIKITPVAGYTDYLNKDSTNRNLDIIKNDPSNLDRWEEWYVVFSDQNMFVYSHTDRFASEEIAAVEHPVLGSIKEALNDYSVHGIFTEPPSYGRWASPIGFARRYQAMTGLFAGYNPLSVNDKNFYLPKEKQSEDFRHEDIGPFTRDSAHRPTPYLIMDVPLVCKLKLLLPVYSTLPIRPRITNNLVVMSSLDQLFNPLRARIGPYTLYQIRFIYRTAYTAFNGLVVTTKKRMQARQQKEADVAGRSSGHWRPRVVVHTGFWGCGSFGGNRAVMAYLQMVAASAAGVDELHMHHVPPAGAGSIGEREQNDVRRAMRWFEEDVVEGGAKFVEGVDGEAEWEVPRSVITDKMDVKTKKEVKENAMVDICLEKLFRRMEERKESWEEAK